MEVLDIVLERPSIHPPTTIMMIISDEGSLGVSVGDGKMDLSLKRLPTIYMVVVEFIVVLIKLMTTEEVNIDLKTPATLLLSIMEEVLIMMGEVDIQLRPATLPHITQVGVLDCRLSMFLLFLLKNVLIVVRDMDTCIRPATIPPITHAGVVDCCITLLIHVLLTKLHMVMRDLAQVVTMEAVDVGLKIPCTITFKIREKFLMVMVELDIGLRPATIPPINQVGVVDCWVYIFLLGRFKKLIMVMKEVIIVVMTEEVYLGFKTPSILRFTTVYIVDCDGRGVYKSQNSQYPYHNQGGIGILLGVYVDGDDRGEHRSQTSHITSHNHGGKCRVYPRLHQYAFSRSV